MLKRNVIGFRISKISINNDPLLFPVLKDSKDADKDINALKSGLLGSSIESVGRHGKYFWLRLLPKNSVNSNVLLMHFGMTGMIKIKDIYSHLVFMENGGDKKVLEKIKDKGVEKKSKYFIKKEDNSTNDESPNDAIAIEKNDEPWPPKFVKMDMELDNGKEQLELAFVDPRRLGRIRYLTGEDVKTDNDLLQIETLRSLGPDYSKPIEAPTKVLEFGDPDPDNHGRPILSLNDFNKLILSKKKPIKSLLLDQAYFSGIGNWVADEICYRARIHPNENISSKITFKEDEILEVIKRLYDAIIYVCMESVKLEGEVSKFPEDWLMPYRWGKARKKGPKAKTNDGYSVDHITIGGRTSCFVPELQPPLKKETGSEKEDGENKDIIVQNKKRKISKSK